ncbi:MAG: hypothetical protein MUC87_19765 [Bacteroidia bacterium]|jgi:hypothetical protein|nr:hypothetical protein [Bacteroidia bacterium]
MQLHIFTLEQNNVTAYLLTPFAREHMPAQLTQKAFAGKLIDPLQGPLKDNVAINPEFLVAMHETVRDVMVNDADVTAEAETQLNGFVFIIDRRAPEGSDIPKEDIIGIFLVNERKTDASRYRPNPDYQLISAKGGPQLPPAVEAELLKRLGE